MERRKEFPSRRRPSLSQTSSRQGKARKEGLSLQVTAGAGVQSVCSASGRESPPRQLCARRVRSPGPAKNNASVEQEGGPRRPECNPSPPPPLSNARQGRRRFSRSRQETTLSRYSTSKRTLRRTRGYRVIHFRRRRRPENVLNFGCSVSTTRKRSFRSSTVTTAI